MANADLRGHGESSMGSAFPHYRELRQNLFDYELFRTGLEHYERLSGVPPDEAMAQFAEAATERHPAELLGPLKRNAFCRAGATFQWAAEREPDGARLC